MLKISPTQIELFRACPRKWFYRYRMGLKTPPTPAMLYGTKVHDDIEACLTGEKPKLETREAIECSYRGFIPDPADYAHFWVEEWIKDADLFPGALVRGRLDLAYIDDEGVLVINDWKVRSKIGTYTRREVLESAQLNIYAAALLNLIDEPVERVCLRYCEMLKVSRGGPAARLSQAVTTPDKIQTVIDQMRPTVDEMIRIADDPDIKPWQVKADKTACFMYGRCEYFNRCREDDLRGRQTQGKETMLNLDDFLKINANIPDPGPVEPEPAPAPAPAPEPEPVEQTTPEPTPAPEPVEQAVKPAPFLPDTYAPDEVPKGLDEIETAAWAWHKVDGIGEKGAAAIVEYFKTTEDAPKTLAECIEQRFDYKRLPGIGAVGAKKIHEAVLKAKPFEPATPELVVDYTQSAQTILCVNCAPGSGGVYFANVCGELGIFKEIEDTLSVDYWDGAPYSEGQRQLAVVVKRRLEEFKGRTIVIRHDEPGANRVISMLTTIADQVYFG